MVWQSYPSNSDVSIAPKTVAVVLKLRTGVLARQYYSIRLFDLFKRANSGCSWNRQLHQAIKNMVFVGFLRPHTLLLYGTSDHIEALRSAWIKNILRAPEQFTILYFGELEALNIEPVSSTNFTPLPDALCSVILQLNRKNVSATVSTIKQHLQHLYSQVEPPSDQVVFEALNNLMREKKVCLADSGYLVAGGAHRKPLSIIISNPKVQPIVVVSPSKQQRRSSSTSSPPLKTKARYQRSSKNDAVDDGGNTDKRSWAGSDGDSRKKSRAKDKGASLRKFFGLKPKGKKANSADSGVTSSGCSSEASHVSSNDDEEGVVELCQVTHCELDSRTASQLSAELIPFQITRLPVGSPNDSMTVHCGKTMIKDPLHPDSDYETESETEVDRYDRVPEMKRHRMKRNRHRATTCLVKKPGYAATRQPANSLNLTEYDSSSYCYGSSYRKRQRKHLHRSDRNSTKLSVSQRHSRLLASLPPDVSSINLCTTASTFQLLPDNSIQSESPVCLSKGSRQSADGEACDAAHHSTPTNTSAQSTKGKRGDFTETPVSKTVRTHRKKNFESEIDNNNCSGESDKSMDSSYCGSPPITIKKVTALQTHL